MNCPNDNCIGCELFSCELVIFSMHIPCRIQCDNGSEFISKEVDRWANENGVKLDFSRPGKPTDNPYVESFNGKFRDVVYP